MAVESVFRVANFLAVVGWLVLLPAAVFGWRRGLDRVCGTIIPLILAGAYVLVLLTFWGGLHVDIDSVAGISALFRQPAAALAGWLHYLAFDMLVGVTLARSMLDEGVPWYVSVGVLLLVFFLGPAGYLLFHAVQLARGGRGAGGRQRSKLPARAPRVKPGSPSPSRPE